MDAITAKGLFCTINFDGTTLTIERSRMSVQGRSIKHIPLSSVQAIQYTPAKRLGPIGIQNGYIAFTLMGGIERQSRNGAQVLSALQDENAVAFTSSKQRITEFDALYQAICSAKGIAA